MPPFIRKVTIRNYKSIATCELEMPELAFLVGKVPDPKSHPRLSN